MNAPLAIPEPCPVNQEENYWHWVYQVAAFSQDKLASYEMLKKQYAGIRPDATHTEYEAAMTRLTDILGV